MTIQNQKHLLPIGFYDLLGDEAKVNQETIDILLNSFYAANYQLIKTPLVEFEESLADNKKVDDQSFKMVDNFSGKTLVIRSDITPQIARLMATKLQNVKAPIRLCYVGDVLKTKNENLYADRQLTQVGVELIGQDSHTSNLEIIELTLSSLKKIFGYSPPSFADANSLSLKMAVHHFLDAPSPINRGNILMINFCCPQFLDILLSGLSVENRDDLRFAVNSKNISEIKKLGGKFADDLIVLTLENNDFAKISSVIKGLPLDQQTKQQLENWQKTIFDIKENHPEINFSVDIFGDDEFSYHNQIGFTIFAGGFSYPIARGGRYIINQKTPAIGSTIYINNLRKILTK